MKQQLLGKDNASLGRTIRRIVVLGIPLMTGRFSHYLMSLADTAMVGRLGIDYLATMAIAGLFTWMTFTFVWPIHTGVQAITSRRVGRIQAGESLVLEEVLTNGVVAGVLASVVAIAVSFTVVPLLRFLNVEERLITHAVEYVSIIRLFLPVFGFIQGVVGFLGGVRRVKEVMVVTVGTNILNVLLNYVFIFGKFGLPPMGIKGAALGTLLAEVVGGIYLLIKLIQLGYLRNIGILKSIKDGGRLMRDVFTQSIPISVQNVVAIGVFLTYETFVGRLGVPALAATHVVFSLYRLNKTIVGGFAQSSAILVGNSLGEGDVRRANLVIVGCEIISGMIGIIIMLTVIIFPGPIVSLFTKDVDAMSIGIRAMQFFAPFFFIEVLGYSFEMIFTANGWPKFVLISEFVTNMVFIIGATMISLFLLGKGLTWVWASFGLYQIFHAVILFGGYLSKAWTRLDVERTKNSMPE